MCSHRSFGGVFGDAFWGRHAAFLGVGVRGRGWVLWARSIWSQPTATRAHNALDALLWLFLGPCLRDVNSDGLSAKALPRTNNGPKKLSKLKK